MPTNSQKLNSNKKEQEEKNTKLKEQILQFEQQIERNYPDCKVTNVTQREIPLSKEWTIPNAVIFEVTSEKGENFYVIAHYNGKELKLEEAAMIRKDGEIIVNKEYADKVNDMTADKSKDRVLKTEERNYLKEENGELKVITAEEKEKERAQKEQTKDEIDKAIRKHEKEERKEPEKEEEQQEKTESPQIEDSDKVLRIVRVKEVEEYSKILGKDFPPTADIYIVEYSDNKFRTVVKQNGKYEMVGGLEYHKLNQEIISGVEGLENQVNGTIRENELTAGKSTDENRYDVLVINDKTFSERETMIKYGRDAQTDVKDIEIRRNGKHIKVLDSEGLYPDEISLEGKPVRVSEELEVEAKREKRKEQKLNEQKAREEEKTGEEKTLWNSY